MKSRTLILAGLGATFIASGAFAQITRTYVSQLFERPISDALGPTTITIDVPDVADPEDIITGVKDITLIGFAHTWAGDLTIDLVAPNGTVVPLLDRPGEPESTFGDSADFTGEDYIWAPGGTIYDSDMFDTTVPAPGPYAPVDGLDFEQLIGRSKVGLWELIITDSVGGDDGTIMGFAITLNNVPAPGALALLGLAGIAGRRRRR